MSPSAASAPLPAVPQPAAADWRQVGCVLKAHGVHGSMRWRLDAEVRLAVGDPVRLSRPHGSLLDSHITALRPMAGGIFASVAAICSREAAIAWHGAHIALAAAQLVPCAPGEFFIVELVGLQVVDANLGCVGHVQQVADNAGQALLCISATGADGRPLERLLPVVPQFIRHLDRQAQTLQVSVPAGLWDDPS